MNAVLAPTNKEMVAAAYTRPLFSSSYALFEGYAGWRLYFSDKKRLRLS